MQTYIGTYVYTYVWCINIWSPSLNYFLKYFINLGWHLKNYMYVFMYIRKQLLVANYQRIPYVKNIFFILPFWLFSLHAFYFFVKNAGLILILIILTKHIVKRVHAIIKIFKPLLLMFEYLYFINAKFLEIKF
jgi:hypothetical protein